MPFLAPALPLIGAGLSALGGLGKGKAQGRAAEADQQTQQDLLRLRAQQLALQAAAFNRGAPGARMGDALRGDVLAGLQPYQLTGEGRTLGATGGLSPALLSAGTRRLGGEISRQALLSQLGQAGQPAGAPGSAGPGPSPSAAVGRGSIGRARARQASQAWATSGTRTPTVPDPYTFHASFQPTPLPESSWLDKLLIGGGIAGDLLPFLPRRLNGVPPGGDNTYGDFG